MSYKVRSGAESSRKLLKVGRGNFASGSNRVGNPTTFGFQPGGNHFIDTLTILLRDYIMHVEVT
jgi:hypothetical protein